MKHPTTDVDSEDDPRDRPRDWRTAVEIMNDSKDLYERKNADYGDSWKLTGKTMAMWLEHQGVDELQIPVNEYTMNSLGLFTRRLDKMVRAFNGWFCMDEGDELQVDENITETQKDQVPYAAMHTQLAEQYAYADLDEMIQ
jgi:hypothetical protein